MSCPHCLSTSTLKRKHRTSLGYRTFYCRDCGRRFNERTGSSFNDLQTRIRSAETGSGSIGEQR